MNVSVHLILHTQSCRTASLYEVNTLGQWRSAAVCRCIAKSSACTVFDQAQEGHAGPRSDDKRGRAPGIRYSTIIYRCFVFGRYLLCFGALGSLGERWDLYDATSLSAWQMHANWHIVLDGVSHFRCCLRRHGRQLRRIIWEKGVEFRPSKSTKTLQLSSCAPFLTVL
eukprot:6198691-Pleurochrysis_carterae.AAC.1